MEKIIDQELVTKQISTIKNVNFSLIPSADEFQHVKVKSPNRFFNAIMSFSLLTIGICLGAIVAWLLINFS